jgi:hypothetical protein
MVSRIEEIINDPPDAQQHDAAVPVDESAAGQLEVYTLAPQRAHVALPGGAAARVEAELSLHDTDANGVADELRGRFRGLVMTAGRAPASMCRRFQADVTLEVVGRIAFGPLGWPRFCGRALVEEPGLRRA